MRPLSFLYLLLAMLANASLADNLDEVHPDERPAVESLDQGRVITEFNDEGRVTKVLVPLGGTLTDDDMRLVASFPEVRDLDLSSARVGDGGLVHLSRLPKLRRLHLPLSLRKALAQNRILLEFVQRNKDFADDSEERRVTDVGVARVAELAELEVLDLQFTRTTDEGLKSLAKLSKLRKLNLDGTDTTDAGLEQLAQLANLQELSLEKTNVSNEAVEQLRRERPRLNITPQVFPVRQQLEAVRELQYQGAVVELDERGRAISVVSEKENEVSFDLGMLLRGATILAEAKDRREFENAAHALAREISLARMRPLRELATLRELDLTGLDVRDDDLALLRNLNVLVSLDLQGTGITDAGLAHLAELTQLEDLHLQNTDTTFGGYMQMLVETQKRSVPEALQIVGLMKQNDDGTPADPWHSTPLVTDETIAYLVPWTSLTNLDLTQCDITDAGLAHVAKMKHLRRLNLAGKPVTCQGVAHLRGLNQLQELDLDSTAVTDTGVAQLAGLKNLRTLSLEHTRVSHEAAEKLLAANPGLELSPDEFPHADIVNVVGPVNREGVWLGFDRDGALVEVMFDQTPTTDDDLRRLSKIKTLTRLYLKGDQISAEGAGHLVRLSGLEELGLEGMPVSSPLLKNLETMTKLKWLNLIGTRIDDRGLARLKSIGDLQRLLLSENDITDAGLVELEHVGSLKELYLRDTRVTDAGVQRLRRLLPDCKIVR